MGHEKSIKVKKLTKKEIREFESQLIEILPNVNDGLHIMKFINAAVESSKNNSKWIDII